MFLFAVILRSLACWSGTSVEAVDAASLGYRLLIAKYSPMIQWEFGPDVRESDFYFLYAGLLRIIRKRLQGKKFTSSIHFNHYFGLLGSFKNTRLKWEILPLVWVVQRQNAFSFRRLRSLRPPPWPGTLHMDPAGGSTPTPPDPRYRFALRARHESYSRLLSTPLFSTWRRSCAPIYAFDVWRRDIRCHTSALTGGCERVEDGAARACLATSSASDHNKQTQR